MNTETRQDTTATDPATELAELRAALQALVDDASFAKGIKVVRAAKIAALLDNA